MDIITSNYAEREETFNSEITKREEETVSCVWWLNEDK
jgi:hypothetical protein